jgi:hypothetical protein
VLWSGPGRAAVGLALLAVLWNAWLSIQALGKIDAAVAASTAQRTHEVDLLVTLNFPPERFHVLLLQRYGRVAQTRGNSVELHGVRPERALDIARYYWISRVERLDG